MVFVKTKEELPLTAEPNENAYVQDTKTFYTYNKGWQNFNLKPNAKPFGMTQYELNKMFVKQSPSTPEEEMKQLLHKFTHTKYQGYFMLLCNDIRYYTVLDFDQMTHDDSDYIEDLIIELLEKQGKIHSINYNEDNSALECWIVKENDECLMFLLFDYDWGVIKCQ